MHLPPCAIIMFYVNWNNVSMQKHMEYIQIFKELSQINMHRTVSRTSRCALTLLVAVLEYVIMHERTSLTFVL